ncbi:Ig-like domain repeat protein [Cellulomonas sp. PhB150]|uniref:Ig-like domain repeat protein n=1 Tax=Cellulomonas sp. PhB150 TaxID=2485188 RepID=UPI000FB6A572|nr:Ig-like domain repeat protein [Cellulomonas sp. PhB150]ROS31320.1 Ig-like protein group 4 [Cellulomonas sp. PhB150]
MTVTSQSRRRRLVAGALTAALATGGTVTGLAVGAAPAAAAISTTITPNPAYAGAPFEGWGNSLVWFANATGGYPDELRDELYDMVFGSDGLNMNVARYNIGGGRASDVGNYFRLGADVDGYWAADTSTAPDSLYGAATTSFADRDALAAAWDPDDPASYDWSKDSTQRWWLQKLASERDDLVLEGFSNSPPYFMTNSGYTSGGASSTAEQVSTANNSPTKFAKYLTTVVEHLEDTYGVTFQSVDPFNEPCTGYWSTPSGRLADGITPFTTAVKKPQEGAQICPGTGAGQQQNLIALLAQQLRGSSSDAVVSANDETNPGNFNTAWSQYGAATKADVDQINVHSYGTNGILQARDTAITADKALWMSETGGDFVGSGFDPVSISGGLGIAQKINDDLRQLQPDAYVLWQEVEDYYNMQKGEKLNWGSVFIDFDCSYVDATGAVVGESDAIGFKSERRVADAITAGTPVADVENCSIVTNSKFDAMRNYMQYIQAGDRLVPTNDTASTAAVTAAGTGLNVVHTNAATQEQVVTLDLSKFGDIAPGATVTPIVTTQAADADDTSTALVRGAPVAVDRTARTATLTVPARSVTTFAVTDVSGVAADANPLVDGATYQAVGVQSSKALAKSSAGTLVIDNLATTAAALKSQQWVAHETTPAGDPTARRSFVLENAGDGTLLSASTAGTSFSTASLADARSSASTTWYLTTMDGTTWSLINKSTASSLDVAGQATAAGTSVGIYGTNGGANQRFTFRSATATPSVAPLSLRTLVGTAAALPATVVPTYSWGAGVATPVTWNVPADAWDTAGTVSLQGTGTDIYGNAITATAVVEVGDVVATDPTSVTVVAGSSLGLVQRAAPATVKAQVGTSASRFALPVTWDFSALSTSSFAAPGVVTVPGTVAAAATGTSDVAAVLHVVVSPAGGVTNVALTSTPTATFTESGYPATRTINGDRTDKGWSNWVSGTKDASETLTYVLKNEGILNQARVYFYKDGTSLTWPTTVKTEYRDAGTGQWTALPTLTTLTDSTTAPAPVATIDLGGVSANAVRFVLTARAATHLVVSETEIDGVAPAASSVSSLARLTVGGVDVADFDPATTSYTVEHRGSAPVVAGVPTDASATVTTVRDGDTATVTVTAVDGTTTVYTVVLDLQVDLGAVRISGSPVAGQQLTASAVTDPADASLTYEWSVDGSPVATGPTFTPGLAEVGKTLTVAAEATASGFRPAQGTSDAVTVLDGRVASTVALSASPTSVVAGKPVVLTARVTSSAQGAVAGGSVAFHDGSVLLGRVTVGADGTARYTIAKPVAGTHTLSADFTPAAGSATVVAPSASSSVRLVVTVPVVTSTTKVSVSPTKATTKTKPVVTVSTRAGSAAAAGSVTVTVKRGTTTVRTTTVRLTNGSAKVTLPAQATPGTYAVTARYAGTTGVSASSASTSFSVVRATTMKAAVSPRTVTSKAKAKVKVGVTASPKATVTGKVTVKVYKGSKLVATKTASLSRSAATVTLPKLAKGTYTVKASYAGSSSAAAATAKSVTLKVKR